MSRIAPSKKQRLRLRNRINIGGLKLITAADTITTARRSVKKPEPFKKKPKQFIISCRDSDSLLTTNHPSFQKVL